MEEQVRRKKGAKMNVALGKLVLVLVPRPNKKQNVSG